MANTNRGTRCGKCGDSGHRAAQCYSEEKLCFKCRQPGHEVRGCPQWKVVSHRTCGGCRQKGHIAANCSSRETWVCKNCADLGHGHWECPKPRALRHMQCLNCGSGGHFAHDCDNNTRHTTDTSSGARRRRQRRKQKCPVSGGPGHMQSQSFGRPPFPSQSEPYKSVGPSPSPSPPQCRQCGSHQHGTDACFIFQDKMDAASEISDDASRSTSQAKKDAACHKRSQTPAQPREDRIKQLKAQDLWQSGINVLEDKRDHAIALLNAAIELDPSRPEYYLTRGKAFMIDQQYTSALQDFDTASTKSSYVATVEVLLQIARCRLLLGSSSSALLAIRDALSFDPGHSTALQMRSRVSDLEGQMDAYKGAVSRCHWRMARSAYESCLAVYAQEDSDAPPQIRCWGIELLIVEGSLEEAFKSVDIFLREAANNTEAMILRGLILFLQAKLPEAMTQLVVVLKFDPDNQNAKALRNRVKDVACLKDNGNESFRKRKHDAAIQAWTEALEQVEERDEEGRGCIIRATLLMNRATAYNALHRFSEGLKDINESLKLHPAYFKAFACRARIMVGLELYETAAENFRTALEHGKSALNAADLLGLEDELKDVERLAARERGQEQDHYLVLGLPKMCTAMEIKKAYRTLSLKHHPDKGGVAEKFKMLAHAYEVLSDPQRRRLYDAKRTRNYASHEDESDDDNDAYEYD